MGQINMPSIINNNIGLKYPLKISTDFGSEKFFLRQAFLKIVSTQNRRKKRLETFLCAAAVLAYLQQWQRLRIMDGQY